MNNKLKNLSKNHCGDWGHQIRGINREGMIMIMFENMGGMGNASDQPIQHKLDTLKNTMTNEVIAIIGLAELK